MTIKNGYKTKHREELLDYLKSIPGQHITAGEICNCLKTKGSTIGTATVYRQLEKLVDHCTKEKCYHCKCESCGKLIHMDCDEIEAFTEHLSEHHGFRIDPYRTVFYGLCGDCVKKESGNGTSSL